MKIPLVDLTAQYLSIKTEIDDAISKVINDTAFIKGKYVNDFEENFASKIGGKHCIGVGNGTDALFISMKTLGIGSGDEVITAANSFIATSESITMTGAKVVFVDVDPRNYNIDPKRIGEKITGKTRAIMPVHLYGHPADMDPIIEIAKKHDLFVIEDASQAHFAEYKGRKVGGIGDMGCFSFYPGKNLGAYGDAGAIVTNSDELNERARKTANHGRIGKYNHEFEGVNSRMDGIQGAVLDVKLRHLAEWTEKRRNIARLYGEMLNDVPDIIRPVEEYYAKHVYHVYVIRAKERNALREHLKNNGISAGIHYPTALPNLPAYGYLGHTPSDFPVASRYQDEVLSLPLYPELSEEQAGVIVSCIKGFY
ncbi:MAG: DegT/DnrJ/EryC1/StrS family aminotransferase [Deltaproteobacteria bacterium]|uniref:DegT/DnrJ/EryC1/StrS family aminotransferase n=1 Tax=Candidatus Zymogenus saltonus TaxID=2844893 RepID=A0A9D8KF03_9DELT|nr:DegT/DnrJ/EryC1/StrS family aminotransferase [Candidatus Zymogenus saltonus]